ncbi:acidic proline-rich protein PRP25-like [Piliocolobus tephrosceles]|uniref:acidic proline-rich protein PRP25-like n=1 Tax=Piliocolobus tephrosceles TaxID=591936 RepID=UPI000E6AEA63|nr:acidic proline-rich protein PRP25-like [Piliocolobus tephrosceles]
MDTPNLVFSIISRAGDVGTYPWEPEDAKENTITILNITAYHIKSTPRWRGVLPREELEATATGRERRQEGPAWPSPFILLSGVVRRKRKRRRLAEEEVRARTRQKRAPPEGSPSNRRTQGNPPWERVAGSFCRLPVAPRQSRSRAAEPLPGFPTGRPGGWGRCGTSPSCPNARAPPLPGQVQRVPPCPQRAAGPGTPGGRAEERPGFSASQPAPGVRSLRPGFQHGKRLEGPSQPKDDRH